MKLYFNFRPDEKIFIFKIFFYYLILLIIFIISITSLIYIILSVRNFYIQKKAVNILYKKLENIKNKLKNPQQNKEIYNLLKYLQIFIINSKVHNINEILNKTALSEKAKNEIIDFIYKEIPITDNTKNEIKNFLKNL